MKFPRSLVLTMAALTTAAFAGLAVGAEGPAAAADGDAPAPAAAAQCSSDPLTMAYYRTWRDIQTDPSANSNLPYPNVLAMDQLPDGIDVAFVFDGGDTSGSPYWDVLRDTYVPNLHAKGTKVVRTIWINEIANAAIPLEQAAYDAFAQNLVDTYVTPWNLDGIDIDMESTLTAEQTTRATGIITALGRLIGPQSGTDTLLIYDTNRNGDVPLFRNVAPYLSYVLIQSYGRQVSGLQSTWDTYAPYIDPCQYLIGFSFFEEQDRTRWGDAEDPFEGSRAEAYALWQPEGLRKGGIFAYAVDRDGKVFGDDTITLTDFSWMRRLIALQDANAPTPTPTPAPSVSGAPTPATPAPSAPATANPQGPGAPLSSGAGASSTRAGASSTGQATRAGGQGRLPQTGTDSRGWTILAVVLTLSGASLVAVAVVRRTARGR